MIRHISTRALRAMAFAACGFAFVSSVMIATAQENKNETQYAPTAADSILRGIGRELLVDARLVTDGETIERGMTWRVFSDSTDGEGKHPLVATGKGGTASFTLAPGNYLVHAAFGRAGATKRVKVSATDVSESFVLEAGGLLLNAESGQSKIPPRDLRFSIYELAQNEDGDRKLIALNVAADKVIRLHEGTYHVLSRYGTINATVRADLEVKAGSVTSALLQHRGAPVRLKLVSEAGGDPLANTSWAVFTEQGEKVFSSTSVSPTFVLAEGTYEASVANGERNFKTVFEVTPGPTHLVELLLE